MPRTIKVPHEVSDQLLADIIEQASAYSLDAWAEVVTFTRNESPDLTRMVIKEFDPIDDGVVNAGYHSITGESIARGIQKIVELIPPNPRIPPHNGPTTIWQIRDWVIVAVTDNDASMIDPATADAIIQYAQFGETPYS